MLDVDREAITDGPVGRVLLLLAAPLVAQNLVYVANALVDTFWLGRVSGTRSPRSGSASRSSRFWARRWSSPPSGRRSSSRSAPAARMVRARATGRGQRRARRARGHRSDRGPRRRVSGGAGSTPRRGPGARRHHRDVPRDYRRRAPRSARSATRWRTASPPTATRGPSST